MGKKNVFLLVVLLMVVSVLSAGPSAAAASYGQSIHIEKGSLMPTKAKFAINLTKLSVSKKQSVLEKNSISSKLASNDQYIVISNESTDGAVIQPTGSFQMRNLKKPGDNTYKIDVNQSLGQKQKQKDIYRKSTHSIVTTYKVGDRKNFWITDFTDYSHEQISATLGYSGKKANVWVYQKQITNADAVKLGAEFDIKIYSTVVNHFGPESDVNHDGKIDILCFDIPDGFSGSGGYIGGYFGADDLYNTTYSNKEEIFYIDTYPTMGMGSTKDVTEAYQTLAHEFQHMVNYNQNVLVEKGKEMDTWLDEAMSMAAEQMYLGHGLNDRLDYFNQSASIENGHSLLYWDSYGDTLANYSLSYLFGQYLKVQSGRGDQIFKEIMRDPNNDYKAVENMAKKYINPKLTFGKLMTDFRIALLLKEPKGLYGFKGDAFFNALQDQFFTGNSVQLHGGGAVVIPRRNIALPTAKGANITYTLVDKHQGVAEIDMTPPASPIVNGVGDADTQITGKAELNATVVAFVGSKEIGHAVSRGTRVFALPIRKQAAGTVVKIIAKDASGNISKPTTVVVKDVTAPSKPSVDGVTDQMKFIEGKAESGASIIISRNGSLIGSGSAGTDGKFKVLITKQAAGAKLRITATDFAGNRSEPVFITVKHQDKTSKGNSSTKKISISIKNSGNWSKGITPPRVAREPSLNRSILIQTNLLYPGSKNLFGKWQIFVLF
ncbi:Ig-like domain-containing protein [Neobacillus sp. LXY-1]|uniref:Ig-like domain-containing protein n=1 Tax=Neobacillus sp. LXY-1 TaxID=3379133 RepID=UPI003EDF2A85